LVSTMSSTVDVKPIYEGIGKVFEDAGLDEKFHVPAMVDVIFEMIKRQREANIINEWGLSCLNCPALKNEDNQAPLP